MSSPCTCFLGLPLRESAWEFWWFLDGFRRFLNFFFTLITVSSFLPFFISGTFFYFFLFFCSFMPNILQFMSLLRQFRLLLQNDAFWPNFILSFYSLCFTFHTCKTPLLDSKTKAKNWRWNIKKWPFLGTEQYVKNGKKDDFFGTVSSGLAECARALCRCLKRHSMQFQRFSLFSRLDSSEFGMTADWRPIWA